MVFLPLNVPDEPTLLQLTARTFQPRRSQRGDRLPGFLTAYTNCFAVELFAWLRFIWSGEVNNVVFAHGSARRLWFRFPFAEPFCSPGFPPLNRIRAGDVGYKRSAVLASRGVGPNPHEAPINDPARNPAHQRQVNFEPSILRHVWSPLIEFSFFGRPLHLPRLLH